MSIHQPGPEDITDAYLDGDRVFVRGTAGAALRSRDFRVVWLGIFASNIGTWMQNVLLGAYGFALTGSTTFVAILFFCHGKSCRPNFFCQSIRSCVKFFTSINFITFSDTLSKSKWIVALELFV